MPSLVLAFRRQQYADGDGLPPRTVALSAQLSKFHDDCQVLALRDPGALALLIELTHELRIDSQRTAPA